MSGDESGEILLLEPETESHAGFLREVFDSTREREMDLVDWSELQKEAFLSMQFHAQRRHHREHFQNADFRIVSCDGAPAGRLCVHRGEGEIRIVDLALLPRYRGRGTGTRLIGRILEESDRAGIPVRLHVEKDNAAQRLYRRSGFVPVEDKGAHWLMERKPAQAA